jgi:hypothetical protein
MPARKGPGNYDPSLYFDQCDLPFNACAFCGGKGELLCDYILGYALPGFRTEEERSASRKAGLDIRVAIAQRRPVTCDTQFCRRCGRLVRRVHVDGTNSRGVRMGWSETVDHCMVHRDLPQPREIRSLTLLDEQKAREQVAREVEAARASLPQRDSNIITLPVRKIGL